MLFLSTFGIRILLYVSASNHLASLDSISRGEDILPHISVIPKGNSGKDRFDKIETPQCCLPFPYGKSIKSNVPS